MHVIKPRHTRLDETQVPHNKFLVDKNHYKFISVMIGYDRILRIPFTASVQLEPLLLKAGPGGQTPSKVCLVGRQLPFEYRY